MGVLRAVIKLTDASLAELARQADVPVEIRLDGIEAIAESSNQSQPQPGS